MAVRALKDRRLLVFGCGGGGGGNGGGVFRLLVFGCGGGGRGDGNGRHANTATSNTMEGKQTKTPTATTATTLVEGALISPRALPPLVAQRARVALRAPRADIQESLKR